MGPGSFSYRLEFLNEPVRTTYHRESLPGHCHNNAQFDFIPELSYHSCDVLHVTTCGSLNVIPYNGKENEGFENWLVVLACTRNLGAMRGGMLGSVQVARGARHSDAMPHHRWSAFGFGGNSDTSPVSAPGSPGICTHGLRDDEIHRCSALPGWSAHPVRDPCSWRSGSGHP